MQESVVVHREAVGVALDEVHTLVLQEMIMVAVLDVPGSGGPGSGEVLIAHAQHSLAILHGGRLDNGDGIR